jgi:O-antigen/teichoic acid export membrane protein
MNERPTAVAVVASIDLLAQSGLAVAFVAAGMGAIGVVIGFVVGSAIGLAAALAVARPHLAWVADGRLALQIAREGLPFLPSVVAFVMADSLARMLAATSLNVAAVGEFAVATRIAGVVALASGAFSTAWGPYGLALRPSIRTARVIREVLDVLLVVVTGCAIAFGAMAPEISAVVGGREFIGSGAAIPGLLFAAGLVAVAYVLTTTAGVTRRGRWVALASLVGAATQLLVTVLLLDAQGVGALGVASMVGRATALLLLVWVVRDVGRPSLAGFAALGLGVLGSIVLVPLVESSGSLQLRLGIALAATAITALVVGSTWRGMRPRFEAGTPEQAEERSRHDS